ncbi:MAG: hypothetical protein IJX51_04105 [Clostridia bacterium]|nr:hypothetical protein [Clostridia bacterium]
MDKLSKIIKYIFVIALIAFLAVLFLRICQSDHKALEDIKITDNFIKAYEKDSDIRTHAVNDGFSENGAVFAYSLVYMEDAGYLQLTVRYNVRHMDEVKESYPDFSEENIKYVLKDGKGKVYEPKIIDEERKYNYQYYKLEFTDIDTFDSDLRIYMILGDIEENVSSKNILVIHRHDDTSIPYELSSSEKKLLGK